MREDQYTVIISEIRKLSKRVGGTEEGITRIENDLAGDRKEINDFNVKLGTLDQRVKEFDGTLSRISNKIKDIVHDATAEAVEPVVGVTQDLTSQIKKKTTIRIPVKLPTIFDKLKAMFKGVIEDGR